ncbi:putative phage tail protein [uncultured Clostridium sp.]|uniref:putative phage tail protein n=1 Tax=uncultured Clostridium sp. TaxID=59620 RepID=UPI0028F050EC|nr:putative phage tail protein [uncultured Clostridium sp.]
MQLKNYVPSFISGDKILSKVYEEQQKQIDSTNADIQDLINQCFVETATWGLDTWEKELGIKNNINYSYAIRRSRILAKLKGQGTTTIEAIKNICKSFVEDVEVIEHNKEYYFEIDLLSHSGFPSGFDTLYDSIREVKPSHLGVNYILRAITETDFRVVMVGLQGETVRVFPWTPNNLAYKVDVKIPLMQDRSLENIRTYPVEEGL